MTNKNKELIEGILDEITEDRRKDSAIGFAVKAAKIQAKQDYENSGFARAIIEGETPRALRQSEWDNVVPRADINQEFIEENKSLNREIADKDKEIATLQDEFNAKIAVLQGAIEKNGEGMKEQIDNLEEVGSKAKAENEELLKQLDSADKHNSTLSVESDDLKKQLKSQKGQNTKLRNQIEALTKIEE